MLPIYGGLRWGTAHKDVRESAGDVAANIDEIPFKSHSGTGKDGFEHHGGIDYRRGNAPPRHPDGPAEEMTRGLDGQEQSGDKQEIGEVETQPLGADFHGAQSEYDEVRRDQRDQPDAYVSEV